MRAYMAKQQLGILALALSVLVLIVASAALFAEAGSAQPWPMQAGESVNDVARLFYPKNKSMQRQFSAAVVRLNQGDQAGVNTSLNPANAFEQPATILIPDIKLLSKKSKHQSSQASALKNQTVNGATASSVSLQWQADYDALLKRNTLLRQGLDKINAKLDYLQQVFTGLKVDLMRLIVNVDAPSVSQSASMPAIEQPLAIQNPVVTQDAVATQKIAQHVSAKPVLATAPPANQPASYLYWILPIVLAFLALGILLTFYARRQASNIKLFANATIQPLEKNAFVESLVYIKAPTPPTETTPDFSASLLSPNTLGDGVLESKEDGSAILEQAKAYVYLGREDGAIRLLNAYINAEPKVALQHWLYLLDIYRKIHQKESFLASAKKLHRTFNVVIPEWEKPDPLHTGATNSTKANLEEYAHIVDKVSKLWADCEQETQKITQTKKYLDQLMMDHREGERVGFSLEAFEDILMLRDTLEAKEKLAQKI